MNNVQCLDTIGTCKFRAKS